MLAAPQSTNWPHALDSLYDHGKRRRKQYFPDGLPGMFTLSKTEVADDIDLIEADADRNAFGHLRRRACRSDKDDLEADAEFGETTSSFNHNTTANKLTKRQKLLDRILDEHGIRDDARIELAQVRRALDQTRDQIQSYRDGIARIQRETGQCKIEELTIQKDFEDRKAENARELETLDSLKHQVETALALEAQKVTNVKAQVDSLQTLEQAQAVKDIRIRELQLEVDSLKHELTFMSQAHGLKQQKPDAIMQNGVVEVEEASGSVGEPSLEAFIRRFTEELHELTSRLKKATNVSQETERQKIDLEQSLRLVTSRLDDALAEAKSFSSKLELLTAENESLKQSAERFAEEQLAVKKVSERLMCDVEMSNEKMSAFVMVVEAAEQRAKHAEHRLFQVVQSSAVIKSANIQLQNKLSRLLEVHSALLTEKTHLEKDMVSPHSTEDNVDADANMKNVLMQDLKEVQLDLERLDDDQDTAMDNCQYNDDGSNDDAETQAPRKVGRPSNKEIAARRRSSRN